MENYACDDLKCAITDCNWMHNATLGDERALQKIALIGQGPTHDAITFRTGTK